MNYSKKYKGKYNTKSTRLKGWNYAANGIYFITICTKDKYPFFGNIKNEKMVLNEIGKIAEKYWLEIPDHFSFVILDEFVVMPNHVHGILVINKNKNNGRDVAMNNGRDIAMQRLYVGDNLNMSKISPKKYSLSSIIRSYKSICTKTINKIQNKIFFTWQPKFHDHIIRNKHELKRIRKYKI